MAVSGRLVVWINAFIPRDVPDYTIRIMRGENVGKTAVPLPLVSRIPIPITNNLIKPPNTGYLTDQRSFNSSANASVRMQSFITIDLPTGQVSGLHQTSGTTEVNIETGETRDNAEADMSNCQHSPPYDVLYGLAETLYSRRRILRYGPDPKGEVNFSVYQDLKAFRQISRPWHWDPSESKFGLMVNVKGAASDPCVRHAADIDYDVSFVVDVDQEAGRVSVACLGLIDDFPAFEAYAKYLGETKTLFIVPPPPGNTVVNLLGSADRAVTGVTMFGSGLPAPAPAPFRGQNIFNVFQ
jgi:hypothetical protein